MYGDELLVFNLTPTRAYVKIAFMLKTNICLTGFMGVGKSLTSRKLAEALHFKLIVTDKVIEQRMDLSIEEIFQDLGEPYFRKLERDVVINISQVNNCVIDCGGGIVLNPDNIKDLKKTGLIIHLSASADQIYENIKNTSHRPLLKGVEDVHKKIVELLEERKPYYDQADYIICMDNKTLDEAVEEILRIKRLNE